MPVRFDSSWDYGIFSLWGWLCCSKVSSDNELRNEIQELHETAKSEFAKLKPATGKSSRQSQRGIAKREWKALIDDLEDKPIAYADGLAKRDALEAMVEDIARTLHTESVEASKATEAKAKTTTVQQVREDDGDSFEDDDVFAEHFAPTSVTSTKQIKTKPRPLPTPAERWTSAQRAMGAQCADVQSRLQDGSRASSGYGTHPVNQQSVLQCLPHIPGATWEQGRPDNSGSEVRVFVAKVKGTVERVVWANGLSHDATRRNNDHTVYEQTSENDFTRLSATKHVYEYP